MSKKLWMIVTIGGLLAACATSSHREPAKAPTDGSERYYQLYSSLDFPLYKNERYYNDNKAEELASFMEGSKRVWRAQEKIAASASSENQKAPMRRVFHAKQSGCFTGKLNLITDRPSDTQKKTYVGVFDPSRQASYDVLVRFSNGVGVDQHDKLPDVRGLTIKVVDVKNTQTSQLQTVDFLMTNSPTPFGRDFLEFARFMDHVADLGPVAGGSLFASYHLRAGKALLKTSGIPLISNYKIKSAATQRYWAGHAYLLGDMAMKMNVRPVEKIEWTKKQIKELKEREPNFLAHDLNERVKQRQVKFIFGIQLEKDEKTTPVENNLVEWKEKSSPTIDVAELVIDQTARPEGSPVKDACEVMRFTPGHYIPEHRPLSNMARGRLFAYEASQVGRHGADHIAIRKSHPSDKEPTGADIAGWREQNK